MREHLKIERETKISKLCFASDVDDKMFWKWIKGKRCSSQLGSFMVDGRLTNSSQEIIEMWFNLFKILGSFGQDIFFFNSKFFIENMQISLLYIMFKYFTMLFTYSRLYIKYT